jgi:gamma-glutamyltranspeptidase
MKTAAHARNGRSNVMRIIDWTKYLGNQDCVKLTSDVLVDPWYASLKVWNININYTLPGTDYLLLISFIERQFTITLSILNSNEIRATSTKSINYPFTSCHVGSAIGVLLNDMINDSSLCSCLPNIYVLVGSDSITIASDKDKNEERVAILATPGGCQIITSVLLGILVLEDGKDPKSGLIRPSFNINIYTVS